MSETLEQRIDLAFGLAALEPCEVPVNWLDPRGRGSRSGGNSLLR